MSGTNYTPSLRLAEPVPGNPTVRNVWGGLLNTDMTLIEAAVTGTANVALTGATATLTTANGAADQARNQLIRLTGTPGVTCTVTMPSVAKLGWFVNACSDGSDVILTTGSGTTVTVAADSTYSYIRCDGTNVSRADLWSSSNSLVQWTPVLQFGGASAGVTYASQLGFYVRTGLVVNYSCVIILTSKGSSTGQATIAGLPFLPSGLGNYAANVGFFANFSGLTGTPAVVVKASSPSGKIDLFNGAVEFSGAALTDANFNGNTNLYFSGFYLLQ
jgi:hypothetical protein